MRYISFDIGIKNFAFLVVDVDESQKEMTIKNMDNLNLLPSDKKMKNITFDNIFFRNFHQKMQHFKDIFNSCDLCLMERQLYSKQNYKACTMYHHLYAHLCIFYPKMKIIFIVKLTHRFNTNSMVHFFINHFFVRVFVFIS